MTNAEDFLQTVLLLLHLVQVCSLFQMYILNKNLDLEIKVGFKFETFGYFAL